MKSKNRKFYKANQTILILIFTLFFANIFLNFSIDLNLDSCLNDLKSSQMHDLSGSYIEIDDTDPTKDWAWAISQVWCSGLGTPVNPYLINEVLIDGPAADKSCISIKNSIAYFKITNCLLLNAQGSGLLAGIYMENVTNGRIEFNNCSYNNKGIYLTACSNNRISSNTISFNTDYQGISLNALSNNNEIKFNDILNNYYGIELIDSQSNSIDKNDILENEYEGIVQLNSDYTNITNNEILNNEGPGIELGSNYNNIQSNNIIGQHIGIMLYGEEHTIKNNTIGNCFTKYSQAYGILSEHGDHNNITENYIYNVDSNGIDMWYGNWNLINENIIENCNGSGMYLDVSDTNDILNNTINDCRQSGIYLLNSEQNTLQGNILSNCGFVVEGVVAQMSGLSLETSNLVNNKPVYFYNGVNDLDSNDFINAGQIILYSCSNFEISNLNFYRSSIGLALYSCSLGDISNTISVDNSIEGFRIKEAEYVEIVGCNVSYNYIGISINPLNNSKIFENTVTYNAIGIQGDIFNSQVKNNTFDNNGIGATFSTGWGFEERFDNITVIGNSFCDNSGNGLGISGSFLNISNNNIDRNKGVAISATYLSNSTISNNMVRYNWYGGIYLEDCLECTVSGNIIKYNYEPGNRYRTSGIELKGDTYDASEIWYGGGDILITDNIIEDHEYGIYLHNTINNKIYQNDISDCDQAFNLWYCYLCEFIENKLYDDFWNVFYLDDSTNNSFILNDIRDSGGGFELQRESNYNIFLGNVIADCAHGFELEDSSYNRIINNTIVRVTQCFREKGNCIGNVYENNICEEGWNLPFNIIGTIVGLVGVGAVTSVMMIKRRKYKARS